MFEKLFQFVSDNKNYRSFDLHLNIVDKVFNGGNGALNLFRFYPEQKVIVINKVVFTKSDKNKLEEFCRDYHCEDWQWKYASLGYPDWYFKHLSITMCA